MKVKDMRTKSAAELTKQAGSLRRDIAESVRSRSMGEQQNYRKTAQLRKELARILTIQREQELNADNKEQTK